MTVYIAYGYDAHSTVVLGVYDSLEKADKRCAEYDEESFAAMGVGKWEVE